MSAGVKLVKAPDTGTRVLRGIASTTHEDRHSDVVQSRGIVYALPIPLLANHEHASPVGNVTKVSVFDDRVEIEAEVARGIARADEVWAMVGAGLLKHLSIGFRGLKYERRTGGGLNWTSWELLECSIVAVPSNRHARLLTASGKAAPLPRGSIPLVRAQA